MTDIQIRFDYVLQTDPIVEVQRTTQSTNVITISKTSDKEWIFKAIKHELNLYSDIMKFFQNNVGNYCRVTITNIQIQNGLAFSAPIYDFPIHYDQAFHELNNEDTTDDDDIPNMYPSEIRRKRAVQQ